MKALIVFAVGAMAGALLALFALTEDDDALPNVEPEDWIGA